MTLRGGARITPPGHARVDVPQLLPAREPLGVRRASAWPQDRERHELARSRTSARGLHRLQPEGHPAEVVLRRPRLGSCSTRSPGSPSTTRPGANARSSQRTAGEIARAHAAPTRSSSSARARRRRRACCSTRCATQARSRGSCRSTSASRRCTTRPPRSSSEYPGVDVHPVVGDFTLDLDTIPHDGRRLVAFLGGTIGNLLPDARGAVPRRRRRDARARRLPAARHRPREGRRPPRGRVRRRAGRHRGVQQERAARHEPRARRRLRPRRVRARRGVRRRRRVDRDAAALDDARRPCRSARSISRCAFAAGEEMRTEVSAKFRREPESSGARAPPASTSSSGGPIPAATSRSRSRGSERPGNRLRSARRNRGATAASASRGSATIARSSGTSSTCTTSPVTSTPRWPPMIGMRSSRSRADPVGHRGREVQPVVAEVGFEAQHRAQEQQR